MATFNITAGTGGIDSSIYFELDRDEVRYSLFLFLLFFAYSFICGYQNVGAGMVNSMNDFFNTPNKYISRKPYTIR